MPYTQQNRLIALDTPLGADVLLLQGFHGREEVSQPFRFTLELLSEDAAIAFEKIIGQPVTITIVQADGSLRYINGFVSRFAHTGGDTYLTAYSAEVVPWLWFLTQTTDCRIFQNMTVPDIITKIFRDLGFNDFKTMLQGSFEPREYCVQYRETDFNFVSRLMEQYGIFYFFEHTKDKHTLVLANAPSAHQPCPGQSSARYDHSAGAQLQEDVVTTWHMAQEFRPGKYALTDYNFEIPHSSLMTKITSTVDAGPNKHFELYDYPGEYLQKAQGESLVRIRMEEEEAAHLLFEGSGTCRAFVAGFRFDLQGHTAQSLNKTYVLTRVQHTASVGNSYVGGDVEVGETYVVHFTCLAYDTPYRPPRRTPCPTVQGPQTAVVVGPQGEEIWPDKYGRVKVQFHWDREGQMNENSSCWIRVSTSWAGKQWGAVHIPRIGQEVIVDFLEGDPDQPIIIGSVYNAEQMPPYPLPEHKTRSTVKSRSSKGEGVQGFNEIRFEDKKGEEQFFVHAEKNQDIRVEKDALEWIGQDRHLIIKRDHLEQVDGDAHLTVKGDQNEQVNGTVSLKVSMDIQEKAGMKYALDAGTEIHLKAGMNLVIESGANLTLKVGGNFININPGGIFISGTMVMINSGGGAAGSGAGSSPQPPKVPQEADKAVGGAKDKPPPPPPPLAPTTYSPAALAMKSAAQSGTPFCET